MELAHCAFPLLRSITRKETDAFKDIDCLFLVGSRPRGPGMERGDLLKANGEIF